MFDLAGPVDTPFVGGSFRFKLQFGADYPNSPPKGWFLTRIFHPNVAWQSGEICVSTLKRDWSKTLGLRHVLISIRCLLIEPNPESALNEEAGKLLLEAYADYASRAKMMTKVHAKPAAAVATGSAADASDAAAAEGAKHSAGAVAPAPIAGEEENSNCLNVAPSAAAGAVAKKPLGPAAAGLGNSAPAAASKLAASSASAAADKAKLLKKKSLKRI